MLKLYNTLARKKQSFKPITAGNVGMYTCGPTVYNFPHIGNYRAYVFSDILRRYLIYKGLKVKQVMNLTDVDDKTIRDSQKEGVSLKEFTERYSKAFFEDLKSLNILPADVYPKATEHIQQMIDIIDKLMRGGFAYKGEDGSIYYKIGMFKKYGLLANLPLQNLEAGASGRIKKDEYDKEHVQDFALWKSWSYEDGAIFWETKFGKGRPGWHIECSAMSMKYLGPHFDIHTGGVDLIFPHHQNEIAQSEPTTGKTFVNYWLHNEWLLVDNQKMSKSLGNFYTLRDITAKGFAPIFVRYVLLSTHYRQQLNFTLSGLDAAKNSLQRIWDFMQKLDEVKTTEDYPNSKSHRLLNKNSAICYSNESCKSSINDEIRYKVEKLILNVKHKFEKSMDNDLEISEALGAIFVFVKHVNVLLRSKKVSVNDAKTIKHAMLDFDRVLGVIQKVEEAIPANILELVKERDSAREIKNFARADELRTDLQNKGYILEDTPEGTRVKKVA